MGGEQRDGARAEQRERERARPADGRGRGGVRCGALDGQFAEGDAAQRSQVMCRDDEGSPFGKEAAQQCGQAAAGGGVEPLEGLVQQQDLGFLCQARRQERAARLSSGEGGGVTVGEAGKVRVVQRAADRVVVGAAVGSEETRVRDASAGDDLPD